MRRSSSQASHGSESDSSSAASSTDLANSLLMQADVASPATSSEGSVPLKDVSSSKRPRQSIDEATVPFLKKSKGVRSKRQHLELALFDTTTLIKLLANLLQHLATSNDALRSTNDGASVPPSSPQLDTLDISNPVTTPYPRIPFLSPMQTMASSSTMNRNRDLIEEDYFTLESTSQAFHPVASTSQLPATISAAVLDKDNQPLNPIIPQLTASKQAYKSRNATLGFHARNVPGIGIEQYLLRILKYCPTTNEVFIALLVYFDRMARYPITTPSNSPHLSRPIISNNAANIASRHFCVDSFNVHRLIIAGVTVASKFFSDVFYTNSRYAKVGGLPLHELNQLELQFLLLNDFTLTIGVEELQIYADRLIFSQSTVPFTLMSRQGSVQDLVLNNEEEATSHDGNVLKGFPMRPRFRDERQSSESESGSSTIGARSDSSSVASSTGTITESDRMDVDPSSDRE